MPRPLSNAEFVQFTMDYPQYDGLSSSFNMYQGQSAVVNWNNTGQIVLVYDAPDTITVNDNVYPDVYYTDVTDATQIQALIQPGYTALPQSMLDTLPQATKDVIAEESAALGAMVDQLGTALSNYAGAGLNGILSSAGPYLVAAAVLLVVIYGPRR